MSLDARLLSIAEEAAAAAVELVFTNRPSDLQVRTKSSATDYVTQMDLASEQLIRSIIASSRPHDLVIGEENQTDSLEDAAALSDVEASERVVWYVDPIDGTTNYVYDHPGYNISIAAEVDGVMTVGVVADPTHSRTYSAKLGGGAFCNSTALRLPDQTPSESAAEALATALVATGFGYSPDRRARQGRVVAELLPRIRDIRRMGAAALDLCSVASGRVDAYFEVGLGPWDLAAGALIASEAGARVSQIRGGPSIPGSVLACRPELFDPLQDVLGDLDAGLA